MRAARNGSSPKYSKVRPLSGVRIMFTAGAKTTSLPFFLTSSPMIAAWRNARSSENVEASDIGAGIAVARPCRVPTGPSLKYTGGSPTRSTPLSVPVCECSRPATPVSSSPASKPTFSSRVSAARSRPARSSGDSEVSHHGRSDGSPQRPAPCAAGTNTARLTSAVTKLSSNPRPRKRRTMTQILVALAALALPASAGAAERATADRTDEIPDDQVHLLYVLPADGQDRSLDVDGTIGRSFEVAQGWLRGQTGGRALRLDVSGGEADVTFFRMSATDADVASKGDFVRDEIERE